MIDLSTCVPGQLIRFENKQIGSVTASRRWSGSRDFYSVYTGSPWPRCWYTRDGLQDRIVQDPGWKIVEILPLETPDENQ